MNQLLLVTEYHAFSITPQELKDIAAKAISHTFDLWRNVVKLAIRFSFLLIYIFLVHLITTPLDASNAFDYYYYHIRIGNMNNDHSIFTCQSCVKNT